MSNADEKVDPSLVHDEHCSAKTRYTVAIRSTSGAPVTGFASMHAIPRSVISVQRLCKTKRGDRCLPELELECVDGMTIGRGFAN